jgi:regulator of protease activity HflC (stomatin/prohibitin superfamily)
MKKLLFVILVLFSAASLTGCVETIDAGSVGLSFNKAGNERGVSNITQVSGWVWYNPVFTRIIEFPIFTQNKTYDEFSVNSKDGSEFKVDPTLNYYAQSEKVPTIYTQFRKTLPEIEDGYIKTAVIESYRVVTNSYTADSLISHRGAYESQVKTNLVDKLTSQGFVVQQLTTKLDPPQSLTAAINLKNTQVQTNLRIQNLKIQAEAEAQVAIAQAEGRAKAVKINADAQAYANEKTKQSLTPLLLEQQKLSKWNGVLPVTVLGSNTMFGLK